MVSSTFSGASPLDVPQSKDKAAAEAPYAWIINPVFDFLLVCGGGPLLLFLLNYLYLGWVVPHDLSSSAQKTLIVLGYLGQHIFADSHNTATYMRIWGSAEDRERFKFHRTWLVYSCIPIFALGLTLPGFTSNLVYLYLVTVFWHYAAQTFGIALIYCYKRGYYLNNTEKEIFRWFILSMSGYVIVRFLSSPDISPKQWFGVDMPFWGPIPQVVVSVAKFLFLMLTASFVGVVLKKYFVDGKLIPIPSLILVITLACLGLARDTASLMMWFYVPPFFHGSQYLAVCLAYYLKERGFPEGVPFSQIGSMLKTWPALRYWGTVVLTGCFFYVGIPHFFRQIGYDYAMVAGLVLGVVNYHHFITDAAIWRLRDPRCRKILLA